MKKGEKKKSITKERQRVLDMSAGTTPWGMWGPYLSERAWATVREDYSPNGDAWGFFPHDHAHRRAYRWNEDGIGGISDEKQFLCLAFSFWNKKDPILKERFFGLTGPQGNHGEDAKEAWFYEESTPTHSYMRMHYKYPQCRFPYEDLVTQNANKSRLEPELELWDLGVFNENRYFSIDFEYAKDGPEDLCILLKITNLGPDVAEIDVLPNLWFRNTWSWGREPARPELSRVENSAFETIEAQHPVLGAYRLSIEDCDQVLFTENETNAHSLWGSENSPQYSKDAFHRYIISQESAAVNPNKRGTKGAFLVSRALGPQKTLQIRLRLSGPSATQEAQPFARFQEIFDQRKADCEAFYNDLQPSSMTEDERQIQRQSLAGMMWGKQFYHYVVDEWLDGDPVGPPPPLERNQGRNNEWRHLYNARVMSMPDPWEYPWYAAWDLAFHCIPIALVDPKFAKDQLDLLVREWYQHPNGQIPAYEWNFGDVNPPVSAWAAWRVYRIEKKEHGFADRPFLESMFHKLLLNFTWWVNRKDSEGKNIFQGGFLGLDNIGVFDRSKPLPTGGHLEQSDGTSWMGMFSLNMMKIALELARENPVYENIATKFLEHFLAIAQALNHLGLWDEEDKFFYDVLHLPNGERKHLRVRSLVGLMPLLAVETLEPEELDAFPGFKYRLEWYLNYRKDLTDLVSRWEVPGSGARRLVALVRGHRMKRLLSRMLDPEEFLSPYGVRSLSRYHEKHPYVFEMGAEKYCVEYEPAEGKTAAFGGNSNWRGPVWFPINYLLIEAIQKFHYYYGDDFLIESPTGSGQKYTLDDIADNLSQRLIALFRKDETGARPFQGRDAEFFRGADWKDKIWFHEYFHAEDGSGLGASHQTGWTGVVAKLLQQQAKRRLRKKPK